MKDRDSVESIKRIPIFRTVSEEHLLMLLETPGCTITTYSPDSIVAFRGDEYTKLMVIIKGSIAAEFQDHRGKVLKVETLKQGEAVATAIIFSPDPLLPVTLTATEKTTVLNVPKKELFTLMEKDKQFLQNIVEDMGNRLAVLAEKLYLVQFSTIKQKIAVYLLDQADKQHTDSPELKITKEMLAEIFGVTRPSLSRCFSELVEDGLIEQKGKRVHLTRKDLLLDLLEEE